MTAIPVRAKTAPRPLEKIESILTWKIARPPGGAENTYSAILRLPTYKYMPIPVGMSIAAMAMISQSRIVSVLCHLTRLLTIVSIVFLDI